MEVHVKWPPMPKRKFIRDSKNPTIDNAVEINAFRGGNPNKARHENRGRRADGGMQI